jgi:hypothetical protein
MPFCCTENEGEPENGVRSHRGTEGARIRTETLILTGTETGKRSLLQDVVVQPNG